jgi:predicted MFS family arabinose efflux permease
MVTQVPGLRRIFTYGVVSRLYFHLPILFVFLLLRDYGVFDVEVLLAVYGISLTLASRAGQLLPPTLPQRYVVAVGEVVKAVGLLAIVAASPYWLALVGQVLSGAGFGFTAGRETALLRAIAPPERATALQGNLQSYIFLSTLAGGAVGAVLFDAAHWLPFVASIVSILVAAAVVAAVHEPAPTTPAGGGPTAGAKAPMSGDRATWVAYYVVSRALAMALFVGFLPYLFFVRLQLHVALFGVVLGLYSVSAFVSARYVARFGERVGNRAAAVLSAVLVLAAVLLFLQGSLAAALVGIAVLGLGAGGVRPLGLAGLRLGELAGDARGALLVRQEQIFGVVNATVLVVGGAILDGSSFRVLMVVFAAGYAVFAAGFSVAARPRPQPAAVATPAEARR